MLLFTKLLVNNVTLSIKTRDIELLVLLLPASLQLFWKQIKWFEHNFFFKYINFYHVHTSFARLQYKEITKFIT